MAGLIGATWRSDVQAALDGIAPLQEQYPGDTALLSANRQLVYLASLLDGIEEDDSALEEITLGYLAMYQLADVISPDLSETMCNISDRVRRYLRQQGRQLKIDQR